MGEPQFHAKEKLVLSEEPKPKSFHLFNCDNTYNLDVFETLLLQMKEKLSFDFSIVMHYFPLSQMSEMCSTTIPELQMDFAVFVVHANESRLSINEDNVGLGYAKIYRALLKATGEKVVVVIGGDDNYKNEDEEDRVVLSRWSRRKVSSQFTEEFMDGRKGFIFSWNKKHRPIHEAALLHYFDANKIGQRFEYLPPTKQENEEKTREVLKLGNPSGVKGDGTTSEGQSEAKRLKPQHERSISETKTQEGKKWEMEKDWEELTHADAMDASKTSKDLAILCRDESEIPDVKGLFGLLSMRMRPDVVSGTPSEMQTYLENNSLKVCVICLGDQNLKHVLNSGSEEWPFGEVLRAAQKSVVNKVIVIICGDKSKTGASMSRNDEPRITEKIERLLGEKGFILWWKGGSLPIHIPNSDPVTNKQIPEVEGNPSGIEGDETTSDSFHVAMDTEASGSTDYTSVSAVSLEETGGSNPETLLLWTRMYYGIISFDSYAVKVWKDNWKAPEEMTKDLLLNWQTTPVAELLVYCENKKENVNIRTVVRTESAVDQVLSYIIDFMDFEC